jgi:hypothetical protein
MTIILAAKPTPAVNFRRTENTTAPSGFHQLVEVPNPYKQSLGNVFCVTCTSTGQKIENWLAQVGVTILLEVSNHPCDTCHAKICNAVIGKKSGAC